MLKIWHVMMFDVVGGSEEKMEDLLSIATPKGLLQELIGVVHLNQSCRNVWGRASPGRRDCYWEMRKMELDGYGTSGELERTLELSGAY